MSADSRQVYKGMDIGTGKDVEGKIKSQTLHVEGIFQDTTHELIPYELGDIPLWMVDVVQPDEEFSVSHYKALATTVIDSIIKRGRLPIIVGGTGLYTQSLIHPPDTLNIPRDPKLRKSLEHLLVRDLQKRLEVLAPTIFDAMNISDQNNPRRLIRKIEIASFRQPSPSSLKNIRSSVKKSRNQVLHIGLTAPREELYRRIDRRVEKRVAQGIKEEIRILLQKGYSWDLPSMNTLGYKEWKNAVSDESAITRWKFDEHAYARRQMTWFRKQKGIIWFHITDEKFDEKVTQKVAAWYTKEE